MSITLRGQRLHREKTDIFSPSLSLYFSLLFSEIHCLLEKKKRGHCAENSSVRISCRKKKLLHQK